MDLRHVGWDSTSWGQQFQSDYYDPSVLSWISDAVMQKTLGVTKRPIRVTHRVISDVLDSFLNNHISYPGDIHTRYNIPGDGNFSGDFGAVKFNNIGINNLSYSNEPPYSLMKKATENNVGLSSNYIINQVVQFIVEYIKTEYAININNKGYSAWSAVLGANDFGLRAYSPIKLREKRPTPFQFHMRF
jgi:hypothetical protein